MHLIIGAAELFWRHLVLRFKTVIEMAEGRKTGFLGTVQNIPIAVLKKIRRIDQGLLVDIIGRGHFHIVRKFAADIGFA